MTRHISSDYNWDLFATIYVMPDYDKLIDQLSDLCGIIPEYRDIFGNRHETSIDTKKAILAAMKIDAGSAEGLAAAICERQGRPWTCFIEPVKVLSVRGQPFSIAAYVPVAEGEESRLTFSFSLETEQGEREESTFAGDSLTVKDRQWIGAARYVRIDLTDKGSRDIGYYSVTISCRHPENIFPGSVALLEKTCRVIITPDTCYIPPKLESGKTWGLSINLYSIRSSRNRGVGDFTDLKNIIGFTAGLKGGFVGINPLHAIPNMAPHGISPYSPVSRFYKNFIYLDMDSIPEVGASERAREMIDSDAFKNEISRLTAGDKIEYEGVASMKRSLLRHAFDFFCQSEYENDTPRAGAFRKYVTEEGTDLDSFALFIALWEHLNKAHNVYTWQEWPEEYRDPSGKAVQDFRTLNERELLFHKYVQWLIDLQHREAAELAFDVGMPVGLYHDLAIGSNGGGCDTWNSRSLIAENIDVGAPPDDFNPNGQNWGFPPMIPERLKDAGYDFFIQVIRKNMKYNRALRIDHALGLFRLFWIPAGMPAEKGAYVAYPHENLLRIIALESVRNKTMVIAEDLGTIGANVHDALLRFQMLSYRIFYFERNYPDPSFAPPDRYPDLALCAVTTHDLPTVYGYWSGRDIAVRNKLNVFRADESLQQCIDNRDRDRMLVIGALKSQGILPDDFPMVQAMSAELCLAIYEYLARTPCKMAAVSFDDVIGTLDQQNMPGITGSYPNWMQKTPLSIEQVLTDRRFYALSGMFKKYDR